MGLDSRSNEEKRELDVKQAEQGSIKVSTPKGKEGNLIQNRKLANQRGK